MPYFTSTTIKSLNRRMTKNYWKTLPKRVSKEINFRIRNFILKVLHDSHNLEMGKTFKPPGSKHHRQNISQTKQSNKMKWNAIIRKNEPNEVRSDQEKSLIQKDEQENKKSLTSFWIKDVIKISVTSSNPSIYPPTHHSFRPYVCSPVYLSISILHAIRGA